MNPHTRYSTKLERYYYVYYGTFTARAMDRSVYSLSHYNDEKILEG